MHQSWEVSGVPDWLRMIGLYLFATGIFLIFDIGDLLESIKRQNDQLKEREKFICNLTMTDDEWLPDCLRIPPKETR